MNRLPSIATFCFPIMLLLTKVEDAAGQCEFQRFANIEIDAINRFGSSISLSDDKMIIGSRDPVCGGEPHCGSADVYAFSGSTWNLEQQLVMEGASQGDDFGSSVSLDHDIALVGARGDSSPAGVEHGAVYVFQFDGSSWTQQQKLMAPDADSHDGFGHSLDINEDVVVVSAVSDDCAANGECGSAYVFRYDGSNWAFEQKLIASDSFEGDRFGIRVSVHENVILVGADERDCAQGEACGATYVFRFNGSAWVEEQILVSGDPSPYQGFGWSVAVYDNLAVIGAVQDGCADGVRCGSAYLFRYDGAIWYHESKLTASDAHSDALFGWSVSMSINTIVVGATSADCKLFEDCGAAYIFTSNGSEWTENHKFTASDPSQPDGFTDNFGYTVSVDGIWVAVGAPTHSQIDCHDCGAAYVFAIGPDCNGNNQSDFCDILDGTSVDKDLNGLPDECPPGVIPTTSTWGAIVLALLFAVMAKLRFRLDRATMIDSLKP